uniref:Rubredoxin-like domain-containing protein n=1 Tax=Rhodosorus marinus TaxID=101924 RepID=A0A7S2ZTN3_9RHOD|mmetsp:Transcript_29054/g.112962  ORF Transcript_29054/g.112962 Transcript_29054/m.112962 type:complete len:177 (+) Transcript_29054:112-642(+)
MALGFVGGAGVALRKGGSLSAVSPRRSRCRVLRMSEDLDFGDQPVAKKEENIVDDEKEKKKKEIERLRAAEKFIEIDEGKYECQACGYEYNPAKGDRNIGVGPGFAFEELPADFRCPNCNSGKNVFVSVKKVVAGFAENQQYGLGGNTLTEGQKSGLIFGGLAVFFVLFLSGYLLN